MKNSKYYYTLVLSFLIFTNLFSQQTDKVSIKTVGQGKTISDATANALREAISQAYGVFISANTTIVNDSLLKDEIVSLTTGNIEKYDVLSQTEIPNIGYSVILNSVVSLGKLSSFAQSKGAEASFDGGGFAMNIKLQKLNEQAEVIAMNNLLTQTWEYINSAIQFNLQVGQPVLSQSDPTELYNLGVKVVSLIPDSSRLAIESFLFNGLRQISMTPQEVESYKSIAKPIFNIYSYQSNTYLCYALRVKVSLQSFFVFCYRINNLFGAFDLSNNLKQNLKLDIIENESKIISPILNHGAALIYFSPDEYALQHHSQPRIKRESSRTNNDSYKDISQFINHTQIKRAMKNQFYPFEDIRISLSDSLQFFHSDYKSFSYEDYKFFDNIFKGIYDPHTGSTLAYYIKNMFALYDSSSFSFDGFNAVTYNFNFSYTLSDLEKLKDFKVTKLSY
jgi:hypothetical protein